MDQLWDMAVGAGIALAWILGGVFLFSCAAVAMLLIVLAAEKYLVRRYERTQLPLVREKLSALPFFFDLVWDQQREYVEVGEQEFYADASFSLVVAKNGKPIAVIGFALGARTFKVLQLQGITYRLGTIDLDAMLLASAEEAARALGKEWIYIIPARRHSYFTGFNTEVPEERCARQQRMIRRYNELPQQQGYQHPATGRRFRGRGWWRKHLSHDHAPEQAGYVMRPDQRWRCKTL